MFQYDCKTFYRGYDSFAVFTTQRTNVDLSLFLLGEIWSSHIQSLFSLMKSQFLFVKSKRPHFFLLYEIQLFLSNEFWGS